jgi:prolyl-tRNA editing enzyme YbaK/EbsC (Cys-tRNA(Pro) deacylase)
MYTVTQTARQSPDVLVPLFRKGARLDYRAVMTDPSPENVLEDPLVRRVAAALASFGIRGQITVLDGAARTARQAADALGIEIAQIANSLIFRAHRADKMIRPLLVLASGAHRVDTIKVADLLELSQISLADAEFVSRHTGFALGGVAPISPSHPIETIVDVSLSRYDQVWAAAGHPRTVFPTSYDELLRLTRGQAAEVA